MHLDILEVTIMEGVITLVTMTMLAQRTFKSDTLSQSSPESPPLKKQQKTTTNVAVTCVEVEDNLGVSPRPLFGTGSFVVQASWPTTFWKSPVISSHREEDLNY